MKKTWFALLALPLASYGFIACSSSSSGGNDTNTDGGNHPGTDGGGNPGTDGGGNPGTDGGGNPGTDSGTPTGTNPIQGIAATAVLSMDIGGNGALMDSIRFFQAKLYASDPTINAGGGVQYAIDPANPGSPTILRSPSNGAAGTAVDTKLSALISAEVTAKDVVHVWTDGGSSVIANGWDGGATFNPFDSPNDLTMRKSDGTIYVTDPGYQANATTNHVFRIGPSGAVRVVDECKDACRPNGIAISPDEKTLYVGYTYNQGDGVTPHINKFPINADGTLGAATKFADVGTDVDGMAIDDNGNVYAGYASGVAVFAPNGAKWGDIKLPAGTTAEVSSLAFGGPDRKTLYIGAAASIYSVTVGVPGRVE